MRLSFLGSFVLSFFVSGLMTLLGYGVVVSFIVATVLTFTVDVALAQFSCVRNGNTTTCYGTNREGYPASTACTTYGNVTTCYP